MKVFVIVNYRGFGDYDEPFKKAFDSREKVNQYIDDFKKHPKFKECFDELKIFEVEVE